MAKRPAPTRKCIRGNLFERFAQYAKITDTCWEWEGSKRENGYGQMGGYDSRTGSRVPLIAHRVSHELFKGPIPPGLEIDHLCRNVRCVNPAHLEAVDHTTNMRRGSRYKGGPAEMNCKDCGQPFRPANWNENRKRCPSCCLRHRRIVAPCPRCKKERLLTAANTLCRPCYVYSKHKIRPGMPKIALIQHDSHVRLWKKLVNTYYARHRERKLAESKQYYRDNREKCLAYQVVYRANGKFAARQHSPWLFELAEAK